MGLTIVAQTNPKSCPMKLSRRRFLQTSTAFGIGFPALLRAADLNSQLHVAVVGSAGQGLSDLIQIGSHSRVKFTGFCDVDASRFGGADQKFPDVPHFADFREMFEKLGDGIDAVQVSTPDHMHARVALEAMRRGKHVYCEKPLTHTVAEARQMRLQADESKVVTQMGNQIHSAVEYRTAVKSLREGAIGKITAVHSWQANRGNGYTRLTAPPPPAPIPETLRWDLWLGVAPARDFASGVYHPFNWRDWQDFGSGTLGDFGCHILDPVFTALELRAPLSIRAENEEANDQTWPAAETVHYLFPGTPYTTEKTLPLTWYDGGRRPDAALANLPADKELPGAGSLFIGETGTLVLPHVGMPQLYRAKNDPEEIKKEGGANHYHAWVDAVLTGTRTSDGFDYAGPLTEAVLLGNIATRIPGQTLTWEAAAMRIPSEPDAERLLNIEYRSGWEMQGG